MSGNTIAIRRENNPETITISGLVELSKDVGKNTSDIEKLQKETGKLNKMEKELSGVVNETALIRQELRQLNTNDNRIESIIKDGSKGTIKFRYYLVGGVGSAVILIFGCIVTTLIFGLDLTNKSQATMKAGIEKTIKAHNKNLQKQISDNNIRNTENYKDISDQIRDLSKDINKKKNNNGN